MFRPTRALLSAARAYSTVLPGTPRVAGALQNAMNQTAPRTNWTKEEITEIYETPLMELTFAAVSCEELQIIILFR
jgi:biotin synthase